MGNKIKVLRIIGYIFIIAGLAYWLATLFFFPNTYHNDRPESRPAFSTSVSSSTPATSQAPSFAPSPGNPPRVPGLAVAPGNGIASPSDQ